MWKFLLAEDVDPTEIAKSFRDKVLGLATPILIVVGAVAAAFIVYLGIMYAKAEDDGKRKELQKRLIGVIVGFVILSVALAVVLGINWEAFDENGISGFWS